MAAPPWEGSGCERDELCGGSGTRPVGVRVGNRRSGAGGVGGAGALAVHLFLEGSALALTGSIAVVGALAVHALAEGVAVGALLRSQPRRQMAGALAAMGLGPAAGAVSAGLLPAAAEAVLVALVAGVLAQAARMSGKVAAHLAAPGRLLGVRPVAAGLAAVAVTTLAVLLAG
ncbi:hypothetical protein [Streptomyces werraensis]|uniref:hypothetical protein n=1 Tax=Streptomyces werraensis TaxID=68284 RepID=UPI0033A35C10